MIRNYIRQNLTSAVQAKFDKPAMVAGVATGGIAHGVLVAQELGLPFVYVRPESKKHGLGNQVEGSLVTTSDIVVVEDLVSTGKSSLAVVEALRKEGCEVKHMVAIFNYGFEETEALFRKHKVELVTLCDYAHLIRTALELEYIKESEMETLQEWRQKPAQWAQ